MVLKNRTGEKFKTNEGYNITIISYNGYFDCQVEFDDGLIIPVKSYQQISNGEVKNPNHPSVFKIGYIGMGNNVAHIKRKGTKVYDCWYGILKRCYCKDTLLRRPTYKGVIVCSKWHNFQNFADWYHTNYVEGWEVDKDILSKESKIYSEDTCCFVPPYINQLFKSSSRDKDISRFKSMKRFVISKYGKREPFNGFKTAQECLEAYKIEKESYVKDLAEKYKKGLSPKVYEILVNYTVNLNQDEQN